MELSFIDHAVIYVIALVVFLAIDLVWLGVVAKDLYRQQLKKHMAKQFNGAAALAFYLLFIVGILLFAVVPAINADSLMYAMGYGAAYGFFTYLTYGLTNYATLKDWPRKLVPIDLAWGTFLSFMVSTVTYSLYLAF